MDITIDRRTFGIRIDRADAPLAANALADATIEPSIVYHAKRDGQAIFCFLPGVRYAAGERLRSEGQPGDAFLFAGDRLRKGREGVPQLVLVYGEDNAFVEPFDMGYRPRSYTLVGRICDVAALRLAGEEVWRGGTRKICRD